MPSVAEIDAKIALLERSRKNFQPYSSGAQRLDQQLAMLQNARKTAKTAPVKKKAAPKPKVKKVIGHRRVFDGGCDHCRQAAQFLYGSSDLAPIHEGCNCGVAPVFEGENHGLRTDPPPTALPDGELGSRLDQSTPLEFGDVGDELASEAEIDELFDGWEDGLAPEQQDALTDYGNKEGFELNKALRAGSLDADDKEWVADLDSAFVPLERDTMVHRGLNKSWKDLFGAEPAVGGKLTDRAYLSTTHNAELAEQFRKKGVMVDIVVPKGTPTAWLSDNGLGSELILGRGLAMEIIEVKSPSHVVLKVTGRA